MANPCMICLFVPVADAAAAANVEVLIPRIDASLRKELSAVPCLHFAALALLPPHPGEKDALPTLMFEWAIDAGIERGELAAALVTHAAGTITQLLNAARPGGPWATGMPLHDYLENNFDLAAGGFVGVRDRNRRHIEDDDKNFVLARDCFNQLNINPNLDERASIVDTFKAALAQTLAQRQMPALETWKPSPRSIWRRPWMNRPIQAASIAALFVMSPLTALSFGWPALIVALILSGLVLGAATAGAALLLPALSIGTLAALAAAEGLVLALVSLAPYTGMLSVAAWAALLGLALAAAFLAVALALVGNLSGWSWVAVIAASGLVMQWISAGVSRGASAVAAFLRHGSYALSRIASRGATQPNRQEWLPLMLMLAAVVLPGTALAWAGAAPLVLMATAGLVLIWLADHATLRWIAIALAVLWAVGALIVCVDAAAPVALRDFMSAWMAQPPLIAAAVRIAAAAILALVFTAVLALGVFLFSRAGARAPLLAGVLACAGLAILAWWTLPGSGAGRSLTASAAQPRFFVAASVLLFPLLLFAALAGARYRQASKAMSTALMVWLGATCIGVCLVSPAGLAILSTAPALHWILIECIALASGFLLYAAFTAVPRHFLLTAFGLIVLHGLVLAALAQPGSAPASRGIFLALLTGVLIAGSALALRAATSLWRGPARIGDAVVLAGSAAALLLALTAAALALPSALMSRLPEPLTPVADALAAISGGPYAGLILAITLALLVAALLATTVMAAQSYGAAALGVTLTLLTGAAVLGVSLDALLAAWLLLGAAGAGGGALAAAAATPFTAWITATYAAAPLSSVLAGAVLLAAPFAALALAAAGFVLLQAAGSLLDSANEPVNTDLKRSRQMHPAIRACEAKLAYRMQHMISLTEVRRPVWLFAPLLRFVLWAINSIGMIWATEGSLGTAPGIHFGHWHVIDKGRRLVFASNFEVPFGGYLDDFINGTPNGINLIWQCTELCLRDPAGAGHPAVTYARRFPPAAFGYLGGCRNEQWFKSYARDSMVPHLFRHEAYHVTYADIERATRLREALSRVLDAAANTPGTRDHAADDQLLRALES